jgi:hypothetical protein
MNSDCSAIADCRIWRVRIGDGSSGDLLPPSPPAEKATAGQDKAGKAKFSHPTAKEDSVVLLRLDDVEKKSPRERHIRARIQ